MYHSNNLLFKRWLAFISLLIGIIFSATAESVKIGELYYELNISTRQATVVYETITNINYSTLPTDLVIPPYVSYNGTNFDVSEISDQAFANCTSLESITIPASVTSLGTTQSSDVSKLPFYNCKSLKKVVLEDGDQPIYLGCYFTKYSFDTPKGLFADCPLEEAYIGRNITYEDYPTNASFTSSPDKYGYSAFYNQNNLSKVTIGNLVTEISPYLFYENAGMTILTLPCIKKIGKSAFESCDKLTTLNLGDAIEIIEDRAFYNDKSITKLQFPNSIKSIGEAAFYECVSITEATIGSGLKSIGAYAFFGCKSFTGLLLPDGFTTMGKSAFEGCIKLTVAKLGESLTSVPERAFKNCTALSEMFIPASVESINHEAFYDDSGLATITMNEGLKIIGSSVFWNNSGILQFTIPGTVTEIGANCFYGCTKTAYLTFRDGDDILRIYNQEGRSSKIDKLTSIPKQMARENDYFYDCPIRVLYVGRNIVYDYSSSTSIWDPDANSYVTRASAPLINNTDLVSVKIGPKVTFLYHHLLNGCSSITDLKMPERLEKVYSYALANCNNLKELVFPKSLRLLGNYALANDCSLSSVILAEDSTPEASMEIGDYTFQNCSLISHLTIPSKTTSIGNNCFDGVLDLKELTFIDGDKTLTVGNSRLSSTNIKPLFTDCKLNSLYLGRNIKYDLYSQSEQGYSYHPEYSPFHGQESLTNIDISNSGCVTLLYDYLFDGVNNCSQLILPESISELGRYTFSGMVSLDEINIPNSVAWLKDGLFADCTSLSSITIHPAVIRIDKAVFKKCSSLTSVCFESGTELISMEYGATNQNHGLFRDCPIETLFLDRWILYNTENPTRSPFYSVSTLNKLTLGDNLQIIDKYMFAYCTSLKEVSLTDNITSIGSEGFRGCSSLETIRFSKKLSQVGDYGFSDCTSLDNVVFPESMTSIADNSFSNCTSLKTLDLGSKLMIIGPSAFKNDTALEGVEFPESLYGLGVEAFANCTALPYISIRGISSVGRQSFKNCSGLKWISLSDKTTSLGEDSFAGCTEIGYVKSFATMPPEGLVNFVESVPTNGTLFVPEDAIDYYQYSPTWENWHDIRPLNDNVLVSSVKLNQNDISFKAMETVQLSAIVSSDNATDKRVNWKSSDTNIATVDSNGLVTGIGVGETTVMAIAADGSGEKGICNVKVIPTMVESIAIDSDIKTLKKGRTLELSAIVTPATATDTTYHWSTSDALIATVDVNGEVMGIGIGSVDIIATANDNSGVYASYTLNVIPPTKGDSNDNDAVTISDAVNTANYAVGNPVETFNFEAADVNEDNRITLSDASATVTLVLEQPIQMTSIAKVRANEDNVRDGYDRLLIDDYTVNEDGLASICVSLDNWIDYVAMQTDIIVPEGIEIISVNAGKRIEDSHSMLMRRIDGDTIRVVIFDINNSCFISNDQPIMEITYRIAKSSTQPVRLTNILVSDAKANEYILLCEEGNHTAEMTMIEETSKDRIHLDTSPGQINILDAEGYEVMVYTVDGALLNRFYASSDYETIKKDSGVYVVRVGEIVEKVMVKQ